MDALRQWISKSGTLSRARDHFRCADRGVGVDHSFVTVGRRKSERDQAIQTECGRRGVHQHGVVAGRANFLEDRADSSIARSNRYRPQQGRVEAVHLYFLHVVEAPNGNTRAIFAPAFWVRWMGR